ncbi:hypothetical protein BCV70DRAFT_161393 [Testicularia cyperi]|uniref:FHA domain-containing protein n=1 Tax=Testicularia cyperi TaxID=1882483 RepID=A0A317XNY9_9BASI|nr:hypothetical protein BCV70DRAFT_161393 [Testicularia cyperi]
MQQLMGGTPMVSAPSNLGISADSSIPNSSMSGAAGGGVGNGPTSAEAAANAQGLVYPALHLHPLNDTFAPKQISLAPPGPNNRVKIGRQTNAKTVPNPSNGYFDSKVLSRMHAEVWSQNGKVYIKDVKSSNGTFINGERLSPEAQESDVFELHNEDMVEFGIDIVGDDNKTIIHHKVACRVYLVLTAEDALGLRNDFASLYRGGMHGGPLGSSGVGPGAEGGLRRSKAGFSFDHVLSKLQSELQKSKDAWNDLGNITNTMHDIHETLGGGIPPMTSAPYPHLVPPPPGSVSAQQQQQEQQAREAERSATTEAHSATITALQAQLSDTQSSLAAHVERIRSLESMLAEHESIKQEVSSIKLQMEEAKREMDETASFRNTGGDFGTLRGLASVRRLQTGDDFDDGASVASVETVTQNDEASSGSYSGRPTSQRGGVEHVGPRAPPDMPRGFASEDAADLDADKLPEIMEASKLDDVDGSHRLQQELQQQRDEELRAQNAALSSRLEELASQLEQALALSRGLQSQHTQVTDTVRTLEERVQMLEKEVEQKATLMPATISRDTADSTNSSNADLTGDDSSRGILESIEGRWTEFRNDFEDSWRKEREGLQSEREELRKVVQAWDEANRRMEEEWNTDLLHEDDDASGIAADEEGETSDAVSASLSSSLSASSPLTEAGASGSTQSNRNRSKSRGTRRKRQVNSVLRTLLYGSAAAGLDLGRHRHDGDEDDSSHRDDGVDGWSRATRNRLHGGNRDDDALSTSQSTRSLADSNASTRPSTATEVTTPEASPGLLRDEQALDGDDLHSSRSRQHHQSKQQQQRHSTQKGRNGGRDGGDGPQHESGPHGIHAAAAVGVVLITVTAWVIANKDLARLHLPLPGKA